MGYQRQMIRVAHKNSIWQGMYNAYNAANEEMLEYDRHPLPQNDEALGEVFKTIGENSYFGFKNKTQLRYWIYKKAWRKNLHSNGFVVYHIQGEEIYHGDTQAIFDIMSDYKVTGVSSLLDI